MEGNTIEKWPVAHLRNASTHLSLPLLLFVPTIDLDSCSSGDTRHTHLVHPKPTEKARILQCRRITHNSKMLVHW